MSCEKPALFLQGVKGGVDLRMFAGWGHQTLDTVLVIFCV